MEWGGPLPDALTVPQVRAVDANLGNRWRGAGAPRFAVFETACPERWQRVERVGFHPCVDLRNLGNDKIESLNANHLSAKSSLTVEGAFAACDWSFAMGGEGPVDRSND